MSDPLTIPEAAAKYCVVAVHLETYVERVLARNLDFENANAVMSMAVMRRGVDEEIFKVVPADEVSGCAS